MKKNLLIILLACTTLTLFAQADSQKLSYTITVGTGMPMNEPSQVPFTMQATGRYNLTPRFSAGIGTGFSIYEKTLIPLFAQARFLITRPHRFTPYASCSGGYSFAPHKQASGGIFLNPNIGIRYSAAGRMKLIFSIGYELQRLKRLKEYENEYMSVQFKEALGHHSLVVKAGIEF